VFNWLTSRGKSPTIRPVEYEDIAGKPLCDIEETIKKLADRPANFVVQSAQTISRRLIEIAYFDEDVEMEARKRALTIEDVVWKSIETALKGNEQVLKARREAREAHLEQARTSGVFSLMHKIRHTPPERVISEMISTTNASLLPDFPKDILTAQRGHIIGELLRDRASLEIAQDWVAKDEFAVASLKNSNAVVTAGWLVLTREPTATWAFTGHERLELGKYLDDYDRARSSLVALGVLASNERTTFSPTPEPRLIHDLILQSAADSSTREKAGHAERYRTSVATLREEDRAAFMTVVFGLRILIWKKTLASVYGATFANSALNANPEAKLVEQIQPFLTRLEYLYDISLAGDPNASGFHNLIVASEALDFVDRTLPEDQQNQLVQGLASIFSSELFHFPPYVRFILRFAIHGESDVSSAMLEDALE
jgi:hypothetical protein